jgi:hypothetical protein
MPPKLQLKSDTIQRVPTGPAIAAPSQEEKNKEDFVQKGMNKLHDVVEKEVTKAKLDGYAKKIGEKGKDFILELLQSAEPKSTFLQKITDKTLGTVLEEEISNAAGEILNSEEGQKVKAALLNQVQHNPLFVIGGVLAGLAAVYLANVDLKKEGKIKLGAGFTAEVGGDLGKARAMALNSLHAGILYSNKSFEAKVAADYSKDGTVAVSNAMSVGSEHAKASVSATVGSDKSVKLDVSEKLTFPKLELETGFGWQRKDHHILTGHAMLKLGESGRYFMTKVEVDKDGHINLNLAPHFEIGNLTLDPSYSRENNASFVGGSVAFKGPLTLSASAKYGLSDQSINGKIGAQVDIKKTKDLQIGISLDGQIATEKDKKGSGQKISGDIILGLVVTL